MTDSGDKPLNRKRTVGRHAAKIPRNASSWNHDIMPVIITFDDSQTKI